MILRSTLALALVAVLPLAAQADGWSGTGELGLAVARGNAESENLNGKLNFLNEDGQWKHRFFLAALRAKGQVTGDFDGDGIPETRSQLTANRYELGASSAYKFSQRASWVASLRYENDDFAAYAWQQTFSIGFGYQFIDSERTQLSTEIGPGLRRAKDAASGRTESDGIVRGVLDFKHSLTDNTSLVNAFLLEAGDDNTFAQNDLGLMVSMNSRLALKLGLQARHNTEVAPGRKKTDTLSTVNLVYNFK
jgi:putative salt-induced outer membrane protein